MSLRVMEKPPLRLSIDSRSASGRHARFAKDERRAENLYSGLSFSSVTPGGHEACGFTLPRQSGREYPDLAPLSQITVHGAGSEIAFQGRLEQAPRSSGDEVSVSPSAVGNQASLDDDETAREIYRDIDLGRWQGPSPERQLFLLSANFGTDAPSVESDPQGAPALILAGSQWAAASRLAVEGTYDAGGARIGAIYYAWKRTPTISVTDTNWVWRVGVAAGGGLNALDGFEAVELDGAAGPGSGVFTPTAARKLGHVGLLYTSGPAGAPNAKYAIYWTTLAVYGNHGLTKRGTEPWAGFYASDIIAHAARKYTGLNVRDENIVPASFIIEQAAFHDPTTAAEIIRQANRFELYDWAVWDHMEFHYRPRGDGGRVWRARVGESKLEETGADVARIFNGVAVPYSDVDGSAKLVGPPGSGSDTESTDLVDLDQENPVNQLGQQRWELLPSIGVATAAMATEIGRRWIQEQKLANSSGRASLIGHCTDDRGIVRPAWQVRAGDRIVFTDAHSTRERFIVKASYDDDSKTCSIDLDAPPSTHEALLSRIADGQSSLGIG